VAGAAAKLMHMHVWKKALLLLLFMEKKKWQFLVLSWKMC